MKREKPKNVYLLYSMNVPPLNEVSWSWNSIKIKRRYYRTKTVFTIIIQPYIGFGVRRFNGGGKSVLRGMMI